MPYKKILLALAGKDEEKKVIAEAMKIRDLCGAEVSVIHVDDPGAGKISMMMDSARASSEDEVRKWVSDAGFPQDAAGLSVTISSSADYAGAIAEATDDVDLLVTGHNHRNRFLAAITDSTDTQVTDRVRCSVLIVSMR